MTPDQERERHRAYREAHREEIRARDRARRLAAPEHYRATGREAALLTASPNGTTTPAEAPE